MKILKPINEFTVKRSKWLRGEGTIKSKLLRESDNKMCCLGFYCIAAGAEESEILELSGLCSLQDALNIYTPITNDIGRHGIYPANDSKITSDPDREAQLITKFAALGITIKFED